MFIEFHYPAVHSIGRILSLLFFIHSFIHSFRTVTDFSAGVLPIGVKFCVAVRPDLRQVFSYFEGIAPGTAEFWASTGVIWRDMLLAESLVLHFFILLIYEIHRYLQDVTCALEMSYDDDEDHANYLQ